MTWSEIVCYRANGEALFRQFSGIFKKAIDKRKRLNIIENDIKQSHQITDGSGKY